MIINIIAGLVDLQLSYFFVVTRSTTNRDMVRLWLM